VYSIICLCARYLAPEEATEGFQLSSGEEVWKRYSQMARSKAKAASDEPSGRAPLCNLAHLRSSVRLLIFHSRSHPRISGPSRCRASRRLWIPALDVRRNCYPDGPDHAPQQGLPSEVWPKRARDPAPHVLGMLATRQSPSIPPMQAALPIGSEHRNSPPEHRYVPGLPGGVKRIDS
jgi:hypothetical protein